MSDISDRFTQTLPCQCEYHAGQWFFCAFHQAQPFVWGLDLAHGPDHTGTQPPRHQPLHGDHPRPVPGCLDCESALDEARQLEAEHPWWDEQP